MNKEKMKKIANVALNVLLYAFLAICIITVIITITSKKNSGDAAEIFGFQMRIVTSESMAASEHTDVSDYRIKSLPLRTMIFIKTVPDNPARADKWYRNLQVGDVLTFRYVYATQVTITHRISEPVYEKETGGFVIKLAGDNRSNDNGMLYQTIDTSIPNNTNYVIGKVIGKSYLLGLIVSLLMQPLGMVLAIILPCFIIILLEFVKILKVLNAEKEARALKEKEQKDQELDELRRRLAELENQTKAQSASEQTEAVDNNEGGQT